MQKILLAALVIAFGAGAALGQVSPPPPAETAPAAGKPKPKVRAAAPKERTPESIECSKQADAKGLHGKERVRFRANCKSKLLKQKKS